MSKFLTPSVTPRLPQGDFAFLPQTKAFEPEATAAALETAMNTWITDFIPVPNLSIDIHTVRYSTTNIGANVMHSALIFYHLLTSV